MPPHRCKQEVFPMDFQQRLYEMRKQSSLSQEGLASLLGVTRQLGRMKEMGD